MGSIGSSSYLPGDIIAPAGKHCGQHVDRLAVKSIVGETDSFGSETKEVCQACLDEHNAEQRAQRANPDPSTFIECESCSVTDGTVKPVRDPEEGRAGPLYYWCKKCTKEVMDKFLD